MAQRERAMTDYKSTRQTAYAVYAIDAQDFDDTHHIWRWLYQIFGLGRIKICEYVLLERHAKLFSIIIQIASSKIEPMIKRQYTKMSAADAIGSVPCSVLYYISNCGLIDALQFVLHENGAQTEAADEQKTFRHRQVAWSG